MIKLKDLLTEGKISSDVENAARKVGVKFDKKTKSITTNKYSNPEGDISKFGKDTDSVKVNSWFSKGDDVDKQQAEKLIKIVKSKYKLLKTRNFTNSMIATFIKDKKNPRTQFTISYAKTIAGPYIAYEGLVGE
tara:strand:+ start:538 stop:939 length:402 start_codon:yes stop_codon:yes gene_type:complete